MWWRWHHSGGLSQSGKVQPRSLAIRARVWPRVAIRFVRPWLNTTPLPSRSSRLIAASSASCYAWLTVISWPKLVSAQPSRLCNCSAVMLMITWAGAPESTSSVRRTASPASSSSASCIR